MFPKLAFDADIKLENLRVGNNLERASSQQLGFNLNPGVLMIRRQEQMAVTLYGHLDQGMASQSYQLFDRETRLGAVSSVVV